MSGCSSLVKKALNPGKIGKRMKSGVIYHSQRKVWTSSPPRHQGFGGILGAKPAGSIGQKHHSIASKCLISSRKRVPENQRFLNQHYACRCLFPRELGRCKAGNWWTSKSLVGLGALKFSQYWKQMRCSQSAKQNTKKRDRSMERKKATLSAKPVTLMCRGAQKGITNEAGTLTPCYFCKWSDILKRLYENECGKEWIRMAKLLPFLHFSLLQLPMASWTWY